MKSTFLSTFHRLYESVHTTLVNSVRRQGNKIMKPQRPKITQRSVVNKPQKKTVMPWKKKRKDRKEMKRVLKECSNEKNLNNNDDATTDLKSRMESSLERLEKLNEKSLQLRENVSKSKTS